jgi:ankyrin repeat protein
VTYAYKQFIERTPLHMAAGKGLVGVGSLLLSHDADIDAQDGQGNTALHYAAQYSTYFFLSSKNIRSHQFSSSLIFLSFRIQYACS